MRIGMKNLSGESIGDAMVIGTPGASRAPSRLAALLMMGALAGCSGGEDKCIFGCSSGGGETSTTSDPTTGATTGNTTDTEDSGGGGEDEQFENPGDVLNYEDDEGKVFFDLADATGDESNQDQEFLFVIVNKSESDLGFQLSYLRSESSEAAGPPPPGASRAAVPQLSPSRQNLRDAIHAGRLGPASPPPPPGFSATDVGKVREEFRVRSSQEDDSQFELVDATLWAVGDTVTIWVDNDWPIDWDFDCDGIADQPDSRDANGFDNCDLQVIANAIDANIYPTLTSAFGDVPDVNGDEKVTVVITPVLNAMTAFVTDEADIGSMVRSYVDPETDLNDYDISENPLSDEQEVIYVFAPDANGFANAAARTTVEAYTQMELLAEVARGYIWLISYKYKVIDSGGDPEDAWVLEGLSSVGADLTGFGAVYYDDVWDYLDAPHLVPLVNAQDNEVISTTQWGAQYLFFRWLYENADSLVGGDSDTGSSGSDAGAVLLAQFIQSTAAGTDVIETVTGRKMEELVVMWQVALATGALTNSSGDALVDASLWPGYSAASFITAPTSSPQSGDLYGANGYQTGININGVNMFMEGGTTNAPSENTERRVTTSGSDFQTLVTGIDFYGSIAGNYGAQVVRLADIPYELATLRVEASGTSYLGAIVRLEDPTETNYTVENIFSSTDPTSLYLPSLPADGEPVYGYGEIQAPGVTYIVTDSSESATEVVDTDRWILDLSDRTVGQQVEVAIHLTRRYSDANGTGGPDDPWIAVVPQDAIPNPSTSALQQTCGDSGALDFRFPSSLLEYLYYQVFLSGTAIGSTSDGGTDTGGTDGGGGSTGGAGGTGGDTGGDTGGGAGESFSPCGVKAESSMSCALDYDRDQVADADEPMPSSFLQQLDTLACSLVDNDASAYTPYNAEDVFDIDETDTDEESYFDRARDLGGRAIEGGEEAFYTGILTGGEQYVIVVGAGSDQGAYELEVRQIP